MLELRKYLSCPIIKQAKPSQAADIAEVIINSESKFIESTFGDQKKMAKAALTEQLEKNIEGVYVLMEGDSVVGTMKLHLPDALRGGTISYRLLIRHMGIISGIKAGILLSAWDEYSQSPGEAYLEYLYTSSQWKGLGVEQLLLEKAKEISSNRGAKYLTHFVSKYNYHKQGILENEGFITRRKINSFLAKLLRAECNTWYKATFTLIDGPITVREYVVEKIDHMKKIWISRRREVYAAIRLTLALTIIPLVAGTLAYIRGYPLAAIGWSIIASFHLFGAKLYLNGSMFGRYGLAVAMVLEGINLVLRSIWTQSWFDRTWLLPTAFLTFWICYVVLRNSSDEVGHSSVEIKTTG